MTLFGEEPIRTNFDDVGLFHEAIGHYRNTTFNGAQPLDPEDELLDLKRRHLQEELDEFLQGYALNDHAQMADALVDLVYVAMGFAQVMGYPWQEIWDAVQKANMSKRRAHADGHDSKRASSFDIVKPPGFVPPPVARILKQHGFYMVDDDHDETCEEC